MNQYLVLIHDNAKTSPTADEWEEFFALADQSGIFRGGSALGDRTIVGAASATPSNHLGGFMRFDSADKTTVLDLVRKHPVVVHGGSVELCEMPKN